MGFLKQGINHKMLHLEVHTDFLSVAVPVGRMSMSVLPCR